MAQVTRAKATVSWACTFLQWNVWILDTFTVVRELCEFVVHVGGSEVEFFNLAVIRASFADPNLPVTFVNGCGKDLVTVRTYASRFSYLLSFCSFYLNSFQFYHR